MKISASLASWPGLRHDEALAALALGAMEPLFGSLSMDHVQLVPQSFGQLTEDLADRLHSSLPETQFRLHANVRVLPEHRLADLASFADHADWFAQAAKISRRLGASAYTAHAGRRSAATVATVLDNARRCSELFGCPVGVEGLYPAPGDPWLLSSWQEYGQLLASGVPYALDFSHLNILAHHSGQQNINLVQELLASPACIEVHVSDNNGDRDSHQVCRSTPWWFSLLQDHLHHQPCPGFIVFSEGNHRKQTR